MRKWKPRLRNMVFPRFTGAQFLYHLPFNINLISIGYIYYWYFKLDLFTYDGQDASGRMGIMTAVSLITFVIAAIEVLLKLGNRKKTDYVGMTYPVLSCAAMLFLFANDIAHMQLFPVS